jgi:hypothetical protein
MLGSLREGCSLLISFQYCSFILVPVCYILFFFLPAFLLQHSSFVEAKVTYYVSVISYVHLFKRGEAFLLSVVSSMEEHRYVLPSNFYPSLNSLDTLRPRLPLTDSTGNAQYHTVATENIYVDQKGLQPRPPPNVLLPTLPSQPARLPHRTSLEARRSHIRSQRTHRGSRPNPIVESKHYRAYRSRQVKGNDDQKWPDDLEDLFIEGWYLRHYAIFMLTVISSVYAAKNGKTKVFS